MREHGELKKLKVLAVGSLGTLHEALDVPMERTLALRVLPLSGHDESERHEYLERARSWARISHANVVTLHRVEVGEKEARVVLELLKGENLRQVAERGSCAPEEGAELLRQALLGLRELQRVGLAHGDVRPVKLFLQGRRLKLAEPSLGTWRPGCPRRGEMARYAAPEVLRGEAPTVRSDLYSLGVVIFEQLLGAARFRRILADLAQRLPPGSGESGAEADDEAEVDLVWRRFHLSAARLPDLRALDSSMPEELTRMLGRMLEKEPADRYGSPGEALEGFARVKQWSAMLEQLVIEAPVASAEQTIQRNPDRRTLLIAAAGVLGLLATTSVLVLRSHSGPPDDASDPTSGRPPHPSVPGSAKSAPIRGPLPQTPWTADRVRETVAALVAARPATGLALELAGGAPGRVRVGSPLRFAVRSSRAAQVVLLGLSSDGSLAVFYPHSSAAAPWLEAGKREVFPLAQDAADGYEILASRPVGRDWVLALTSARAFPPLPQGDAAGPWLMVYPLGACTAEPCAAPVLLAWLDELEQERAGDLEVARLVYEVVD